MKIALLTDTHWGARGDNPAFQKYFAQFHDELFFPVLKDRKIKTVVHLGDVVDRRKYIQFASHQMMRKHYLEPSSQLDLKTYINVGNHDCFYKNTNDLNALRELVLGRSGFTIYTKPVEETFGDLKVLMLPWIAADCEESTLNTIKSSKANVVFGHLELVGFEMARGQMMEHGMEPSIFKKFKAVYSGHYHHKSSKKNIHYLGTPYEMTWADYADPKGFHILDTDTLELEFIENPNRMFHKVTYSDKSEIPDDLQGKIVKLIVEEGADLKKLEKFVSKLEKTSPTNLQVVADHLNTELKNDDLEVTGVTDTMQILTDYVMGSDFSGDKEKLVGLMKELYRDAQAVGE